jgi:hypothetical protein
MDAVRTSEMTVHSNETTRRYIPEDSKLHTRRRENLKSHFLRTDPDSWSRQLLTKQHDRIVCQFQKCVWSYFKLLPFMKRNCEPHTYKDYIPRLKNSFQLLVHNKKDTITINLPSYGATAQIGPWPPLLSFLISHN